MILTLRSCIFVSSLPSMTIRYDHMMMVWLLELFIYLTPKFQLLIHYIWPKYNPG